MRVSVFSETSPSKLTTYTSLLVDSSIFLLDEHPLRAISADS